MHCDAACGEWAMELLQCTATLPVGSGLWNSCNALPNCLGAVGSGTAARHRQTACGKWAVELLQCTATLLGGSGQGTPVMHGDTAEGQWAVQLLQCTATLPVGNELCNSCNALPHCLWAMSCATPAMHCHIT